MTAKFRLDNSSNLRFVYSRALNRPDPAVLTTAFNIDCSSSPCTITQGSSTLRPEHANNYDLLYERYLNPFGLVQLGFFDKGLSDPLVITSGRWQCDNLPAPGHYLFSLSH